MNQNNCNQEEKNQLLERAFRQAVANSELDFILVEKQEYVALKQNIKLMILKRRNKNDGRRTIQ